MKFLYRLSHDLCAGPARQSVQKCVRVHKGSMGVTGFKSYSISLLCLLKGRESSVICMFTPSHFHYFNINIVITTGTDLDHLNLIKAAEI